MGRDIQKLQTRARGIMAKDASSPEKRAAFAILVLFALCALCAPLFKNLLDTSAPRPKMGRVDYSALQHFNGPVELSGQWMLDWRGTGTAATGEPAGTVPIDVPGSWTGKAGPGGGVLPERGVGSYHLSIRGVPPGSYLLYVPPIYAATRVWVNGSLDSSWGRFGTTSETTSYLVRAHSVPIISSGQNIDLQIDVAAFHHRDTGIEGAPVFGSSPAMSGWVSLQWTQNLLFATSLFLIALYGFVVFLFRRSDRASLLLAINFLANVPIALIFSHDNLLSVVFPRISFATLLAIQYVSGVVSVVALTAYVDALFPQESSKKSLWAIQTGFGVLLIGLTFLLLRGQTLLASHLSQWAEPARLFIFVYLIGVACVAAARRREGALIFLIGVSALLILISLRTLVTNGFVTQSSVPSVNIVPLGILAFLFSQIIILAERWYLAIQAAERSTDELQQLFNVSSSITSEIRLDELLRKIVQVTSKIVQADRSSLFLHDQKTDELWSVVAEGEEAKKLRFDSGLGLAGHSFMHGQVINIDDAYQDPRFNRQIDLETGYKTASILTLPIIARDGRRLGVMQALNRHLQKGFDDDDISRMQAFVAQAAIAIDNATLFAEVTSARNYNESILRSMSTGVITLDSEHRLAKLSPAACSILAVPFDDVEQVDAAEVLTSNNPWLGAELEDVRRTGEPKELMDVDFRIASGDQISVNLSIVPLVSDEEWVGLLMLLEDISEGKRLHGAMRRFMTQEVVDQVMQRDGELLFGTSCEASVLFADIRGFTSIAEHLAPRETVQMLNEIFTELFEAVSGSGGVLDKFMGDAIMAVYGAPLSTGRNPQCAVESAMQMFRLLGLLNAGREDKGSAPIRIGVGIASGDVVAGTIGSPKRMDYTVIGDSVNLASRLQDTTKHYGVELVVCESTAIAVRDQVVMRELDLIRVRGRNQPAKIFQILPDIGPSVSNRLAGFKAYQRGRDQLERRNWANAAEAFEDALRANPEDRPAQIMLERVRALLLEPPAADWDGVWTSPG